MESTSFNIAFASSLPRGGKAGVGADAAPPSVAVTAPVAGATFSVVGGGAGAGAAAGCTAAGATASVVAVAVAGAGASTAGLSATGAAPPVAAGAAGAGSLVEGPELAAAGGALLASWLAAAGACCTGACGAAGWTGTGCSAAWVSGAAGGTAAAALGSGHGFLASSPALSSYQPKVTMYTRTHTWSAPGSHDETNIPRSRNRHDQLIGRRAAGLQAVKAGQRRKSPRLCGSIKAVWMGTYPLSELNASSADLLGCSEAPLGNGCPPSIAHPLFAAWVGRKHPARRSSQSSAFGEGVVVVTQGSKSLPL